MKTNRYYLTFAACMVATLSAFGQPAVPGIIHQPANSMLYVGGNAVFSLMVTGAPPSSFQWRFRGIELPGKTNSSLTVVQAQFTNAGPYSCTAAN